MRRVGYNSRGITDIAERLALARGFLRLLVLHPPDLRPDFRRTLGLFRFILHFLQRHAKRLGMGVFLPGKVDCGDDQQGDQQTTHKIGECLRGTIDTLAKRAGMTERQAAAAGDR